jgi:uncharacterized repeat protein (TIGR01451 family)
MLPRILPLLLLLPLCSAHAVIYQRSISIDGNMTDWTTAPNITTNPDQSNIDAEGNPSTGSGADLDYPIPNTGRDLAGFAYTFDATYLYLWVARYPDAVNNTTDWWFYLDTDNNGTMDSGDKVFRVNWKGNNGNTTATIYDYVESAAGPAPLLCPATGTNSVADGWCPSAGVADGYDMPGDISNGIAQTVPNGGSAAGTQMETRVAWSSMGFSGPGSLGFHISSSNGTNLPNQVNDNMNGPAGSGGGIAFADIAVVKTAPATTVTAGSVFNYTITVTNNGDSDATGINLTDTLPAAVTYISDAPSQGSYDPGTGIWTLGNLINGASASLTISVSANQVTVNTPASNTALVSALDQADPVSTNDSSTFDVTIVPTPDIVVLKSATTLSDPVNAASNPKAIPRAVVQYSVISTNTGFGEADNNSVSLSDRLPAGVEMYVGDLGGAGSGPVVFNASTSGLSYAFNTAGLPDGLQDLTDDIEFSQNNGADNFTYLPTANVDGYDSQVTDFRVNPRGIFDKSDGITNPSFTMQYRVRIR